MLSEEGMAVFDLFGLPALRLTFQQGGVLAWGLAYGGFEYCRKI